LEHGPDQAGTRGGPGFTSTSPHDGNPAALHPHLFRGGGTLLAGNPGLGPPFGQAHAHEGGRIIKVMEKTGWDGREQKVTQTEGHPGRPFCLGVALSHSQAVAEQLSL